MKQVIVGLGEALWDCLPEGKKLGGAPANFAYHAGQFGHDSLAMTHSARRHSMNSTRKGYAISCLR